MTILFYFSRRDQSATNSGYNGFASSDDNQNSYETNGYNMPEKCLVCFMIFPRNMVHRDRVQHINEHYTDS
jgi:hypothetical protein